MVGETRFRIKKKSNCYEVQFKEGFWGKWKFITSFYEFLKAYEYKMRLERQQRLNYLRSL
jgi:hypothetical protein